MKTLDLNAYGVQEMTHQEMVEENGGEFFLAAFAIALCVIYIAAETVSYLVNGNNSMQPAQPAPAPTPPNGEIRPGK